jgi:hypothetical protein
MGASLTRRCGEGEGRRQQAPETQKSAARQGRRGAFFAGVNLSGTGLLAKTHVVAQRAGSSADGRAFIDVAFFLAADMGDGGTSGGTDRGAVDVGRVDVLGAAREGKRKQGSRSRNGQFGHVGSLFLGTVQAVSGGAVRDEAGAATLRPPGHDVLAGLANASVVAKRASGSAQNGTGADIFVKCLGSDRTGTRTNKRALRVGRNAGPAVALLASRQRGDGQNGTNEAERGFGLHVTLPSLSETPFAGWIVAIVTLPQWNVL